MLRRFFFYSLALVFVGVLSCSSPEASSQTENTDTSLPAPPPGEAAAAPVSLEVPYAIVDSSNMLVLDQGLEVYFIYTGSGLKPDINHNILFHYHGMLTDGTVFDSSFERGQPLDSPLRNLIQGWQIALAEVPLGSKVKLIIPPELGYGAQGSTNVPPNATLIFDIELISMY